MGATDTVEGVIDFHVHLPFRYSDPAEAASYLVAKMDEAGVRLAVVIAVEAGVESFRRRMRPSLIRRAAEEVIDYVAYSPSPAVRAAVFEPEKSLEEHERLLIEHRRRTEEVVEAARLYPDRLLPVASYNPDLPRERMLERLRRFEDELLGVKLYPTLHCRSPADRGLSWLYSWAERRRKVVIVHTGCDPGIWELPRFCRYARPRLVAEAARRHPGAVFVVAHMGAYSALMPGIFFREALEAASLENVYLDTSAVDPLFIERAVEEVGHEKILFGSDFPYVTGLGIRDAIREILELPISWRAKEAILRGNAERLLRLLGRL